MKCYSKRLFLLYNISFFASRAENDTPFGEILSTVQTMYLHTFAAE